MDHYLNIPVPIRHDYFRGSLLICESILLSGEWSFGGCAPARLFQITYSDVD